MFRWILMTYDYTCPECKVTISIERSIHAEADAPICNECKQLMARVWATPPVSFKGSGFYVNDK